MKEEEINAAIANVRLENEQLTLKKTEYELRQMQKDFNLPFYRSTEFIRPLVSGLSLALIFSAYIQYIFIPTQNNLNQEIDTAEFIIQKKTEKHEAQLAKLDLIREQIEQKSEQSKLQLKSANEKLKNVLLQNTNLQQQIAKLSAKEDNPVELEEITDQVKRSGKEIKKQIAAIQDTELSIDAVNESSIENEFRKGWMYIGYFPNAEWNYTNIDISTGLPIVGNVYKLTSIVNIRNHAPEFSWFKYKFGKLVGYLETGSRVKIIKTETVGRSKVWAQIETVVIDEIEH